MAKSVLGTDLEHAQSKLQENSGNNSPSVPSESADNRTSQGPEARKTNSPPLYIVGNVSPTLPFIPFPHVENLIQAAGFARLIAKPLHHHLCIRWPTGDWRHHADILRQISEWQRYHVGCPVFVWTKEAKGGAHSHILLHLPSHKSRKFRSMITKHLKKLTGLRSLPTGTIQNRRIWAHGDPFTHMRNRVAYILKRADQDTRSILGTKKSDIGRIEGKAVGVSQSLGVEARSNAGSVLPSGHRVTPPSWQRALTGPHMPVTHRISTRN